MKIINKKELENKIDVLMNNFNEDVKWLNEYADENLEYSRGSQYEALYKELEDELEKEMYSLYWDCIGNEIQPEAIEGLFSGYNFYDPSDWEGLNE